MQIGDGPYLEVAIFLCFSCVQVVQVRSSICLRFKLSQQKFESLEELKNFS